MIDGKEYKTPGEWAMPLENAGLTIRTYDGFLKVYDNFKNIKGPTRDMHEYMVSRTMSIPDQIICSREAFDKAMFRNGITISRDADYVVLADTIPNYAESLLGSAIYARNLSFSEILKHGDVSPNCIENREETIMKMFKALEAYKSVSEINKKINNVTEERPLSDLTGSIESYIFEKYPIAVKAKKRKETVESFQIKLVDELISKLEKVLQGEEQITQDIIDKIDIVYRLITCTQRYRKMLDFDLAEECDIKPDIEDFDQEMKMGTYRVVDSKGIHNYVAGQKDGMTIVMETDKTLYDNAKKSTKGKKRAKSAVPVEYSMENVASMAAIDCTSEDIDDARKSMAEPTKEKGEQKIDE